MIRCSWRISYTAVTGNDRLQIACDPSDIAQTSRRADEQTSDRQVDSQAVLARASDSRRPVQSFRNFQSKSRQISGITRHATPRHAQCPQRYPTVVAWPVCEQRAARTGSIAPLQAAVVCGVEHERVRIRRDPLLPPANVMNWGFLHLRDIPSSRRGIGIDPTSPKTKRSHPSVP